MKRKNHIDLSILSYVCTFSLTRSQQTMHRYYYARFNFRFNPVPYRNSIRDRDTEVAILQLRL